jgi:alpha-1,2-mannosyltransferase
LFPPSRSVQAAVGTPPSGLGRWKLYFVVLYLIAFAAHLPWLASQVARKSELMGSDFTIFYGGWTQVLHGDRSRLYDLAIQRDVQHEIMNGVQFPGGVIPFLHPPHAALVMAPIAWIPRTPATWLWTVFQLALLAWLARTIVCVAGLERGIDRWLLVAALLAYPATFASIQMGQVAILLAVALFELVLSVRAGDDRRAALCLLVLSLKPHLLVVPVAVLLALRCWGVLVRAALGVAVAVVVTMLVLGRDIWRSYFTALPVLERWWGKGGPEFMVNFRGALVRLLGEDGTPAMSLTIYGALAVATVAIYVAVRRRLARGAPDAAGWPGALALGLLFNPHLFLHDAMLWTVPIALTFEQLRRAGRDTTSLAILALSWPLVGLVNEAVERNDRLLPIHLLFVEAVVTTIWILARSSEVLEPTRAV